MKCKIRPGPPDWSEIRCHTTRRTEILLADRMIVIGSLVLFCPFQPFPGFSFTKSCLSSFPFNQTWRSNCRSGQEPWSWRWWWIDWQRLKVSNCSKYLCQFHIGFEFFCPLLNPPFRTRLPPLRPSDDSAKRLITIFRLKISEPGRAGIASERN